MQLLISAVIAFVLTLALIKVLYPLALRIGLVAIPGGRKTHRGAVPLIGGIAMFSSFCVAALFLPISLASQRALFAASALLLFVGVLDDFRELSAKRKFVLQLIASLLVIFVGGVELQNLGNLLFIGDIQLSSWLAVIVTIIAILGILNAVNMSDGLDGLAGSLALVELIFLLYLASLPGWSEAFHLLLLAVVVLAAFLCVNFPFSSRASATIFMGDAGTLFLGLMLSWYLIVLSQRPMLAAQPVTFLWIMAVPLFDAADAIIRRIVLGQSPFKPDRLHIHHLLKYAGFADRSIVIMLMGVAILMGLIGIVANHYHVSSSEMFVVFCLLFVVYSLMSWQLRVLLRGKA